MKKKKPRRRILPLSWLILFGEVLPLFNAGFPLHGFLKASGACFPRKWRRAGIMGKKISPEKNSDAHAVLI
jgi:hypothetical protein